MAERLKIFVAIEQTAPIGRISGLLEKARLNVNARLTYIDNAKEGMLGGDWMTDLRPTLKSKHFTAKVTTNRPVGEVDGRSLTRRQKGLSFLQSILG